MPCVIGLYALTYSISRRRSAELLYYCQRSFSNSVRPADYCSFIQQSLTKIYGEKNLNFIALAKRSTSDGEIAVNLREMFDQLNIWQRWFDSYFELK